MGNAIRLLYRKCCSPTADDKPHGVSASTAGVSALSRDLFHFETTSQVPEGLESYVVSSKKAQANWYRKILEAWKQAKPRPRTPEEASKLVIAALKNHQKADVEGLLTFYGLPSPHKLVEVTTESPASSLPEKGLRFELQTLPVDQKSVADGDTVTVYVSISDPLVSSSVPKDVSLAAVKREKAREKKNYTEADALHKTIIASGYRMINVQNKEVLAKKFRIRLRGIDAPESKMPFGKESHDELLKMVEGKSLKVLVYAEDRYGRCVGDIYCSGKFVQEVMLKKGLAWHYVAYDKRTELAKWESDARQKRVGLWASSNPEKPWEWRKNKRGGN